MADTDTRHDSKVVFITGASSGIGYATALAFARKGYHVAGTARRMDRLEALQAAVITLPPGHGDFLPLAVDVRNGEAVKTAVQQTVNHFGRLDILVANAGIGQRGAVVEASWDDLDTLLRTNIDGVLHSIRAAVPAIRYGKRGGHLVLISSVTFNLTSPYAAVYAASKAFVSSLAKSLRFELQSDQIQVIDMRIGRTVTEFNQRRLGEGQRRNSSSSSSGSGSSRLRLPEMTADQVAVGIVNAVQTNRQTVSLRWIDRLLILANRLIPGVIGRLAMRQYR